MVSREIFSQAKEIIVCSRKNRGDMSQSRPRGRCVSRGALIEACVLVRYTVTFPHRREENGFWFLKGKAFLS